MIYSSNLTHGAIELPLGSTTSHPQQIHILSECIVIDIFKGGFCKIK